MSDLNKTSIEKYIVLECKKKNQFIQTLRNVRGLHFNNTEWNWNMDDNFLF